MEIDREFGLYVEVQLLDENGNVVKRHYQRANSFLFRFAEFLRNLFAHRAGQLPLGVSADNMNMGVSTYSLSHKGWALLAPANIDTYGIIVGSGTTPVSAKDSRLAAKINNDVLAHGDTQYSLATGQNTAEIIFQRQFTNTGSNPVSVNEVGLAMIMAFADETISESLSNSILIERTVLAQTYNINPATSIIVKYTLKIPIAPVV